MVSVSLSHTQLFCPALLWLTGGPDFCHMPSRRCRKLTALNTGHIWVYNTPPFWDSTQSVDFKGLLHCLKIFKHSVKHSFEQEPIFFSTHAARLRGVLDSSLNEFIAKYASSFFFFEPFFSPQKQLQKMSHWFWQMQMAVLLSPDLLEFKRRTKSGVAMKLFQ